MCQNVCSWDSTSFQGLNMTLDANTFFRWLKEMLEMRMRGVQKLKWGKRQRDWTNWPWQLSLKLEPSVCPIPCKSHVETTTPQSKPSNGYHMYVISGPMFKVLTGNPHLPSDWCVRKFWSSSGWHRPKNRFQAPPVSPPPRRRLEWPCSHKPTRSWLNSDKNISGVRTCQYLCGGST